MASEWSAPMVAVAMIVLVGVVSVTAIRKYQAEQALKVMGAMSGVTGVIVGSVGTYFFGVAPANRRARQLEFRNDVATAALEGRGANQPATPAFALKEPIIDWAAERENRKKLESWLAKQNVDLPPALWVAEARPEELQKAMRELEVEKP